MNKLLICFSIAILLGIILLAYQQKKKKQEILRRKVYPENGDYQRIKLSLPISKCLECQDYQAGRDNNCCSACSQGVNCVNPGGNTSCFQHQHHKHHCHSQHHANNIKQDYSLWLIFLIIGIVIAYLINRLSLTSSRKRTGE